jgi:hypothetical protein
MEEKAKLGIGPRGAPWQVVTCFLLPGQLWHLSIITRLRTKAYYQSLIFYYINIIES